jgi:hypothetical protein
MGLRIRRMPSRKVRVITTIIAAFALVMQPLLNVVNTANAISPAPITVVRPGAMNGWMGVDDNEHGGSLSFSASPAGAPLGEGSAQLKVSNSSQGYMLFKPGYGGTKLADLTTLSYKTYVTTGTNLIAPSVQINVDRDTTDGDTSWQGRLVYEPYMNSTVHDGQWQTWNPLAGKWWLSKADSKFDGHCGQGSPCTIAQLTSQFPNIGVNGGASAGIGFKAGSSWNSFVGSIDDFAINQDRYDFEPLTGPELVSPANDDIVKGVTLTNKWAAVDGAAKYIYESYKNAAATQLRWHEETTATQKSATNVANGTTFWWRVKSVDADGNVSAWSPLWKVTVDNVAPTVPTGGQPNGTTQPTNEFDFTWNASADTSHVTYEYQATQNSAQTDGVLTASLWKSGILSTPMIHSSGAGDGTWYWQVRATDAAGNVSAWSPIWQMRIDSQGPSLNVTNPNEGQLFGGANLTATVEATASDPSGLGAYYVAIDGAGKKYVFHPANGDMATTAIDLSSLTEGNHTILVRVTDLVGHATEIKRHITIDRTAPTVTVSSPITGQVVGGTTLDITGTVTDSSGLSEYRYQLLDSNKDNTLGNSVIGGHDEVVDGALGSLDISGLPSGDYYVRVWAKDDLGNTSAPSYVKFTVDHTAPVVTLQSDKTNPMASSQVTFSGKVTNGADLDTLALYNGTVQVADLTGSVDSNGNWSYAFPPEDLVAGNYTFSVVATDTSGNMSDTITSPQSVFSMSVTPFVPGRGAIISPAITQQLTRTIAIPAIVPTAIPAAQSNDQAVLGTQTEKNSDVKGASDDKLAAIAPTENGWKLFGIVWYWWLLILAVVALLVWRTAVWVRREDDVLPA